MAAVAVAVVQEKVVAENIGAAGLRPQFAHSTRSPDFEDPPQLALAAVELLLVRRVDLVEVAAVVARAAGQRQVPLRQQH